MVIFVGDIMSSCFPEDMECLYKEVKNTFAGCTTVPLSLIQLRFGIGIKKAALIKERLYEEGILSNAIENTPDKSDKAEKRLAEVALEAIRIRPLMLEFISNQTEELCLAAVQTDGLALEFVKHQTAKICEAAIRNNPAAIQFIRRQEKE